MESPYFHIEGGFVMEQTAKTTKLTEAGNVWLIFMFVTIAFGVAVGFIDYGGGAIGHILSGLWTIWTSPALLPSDYIAMAGIGPAFVNSGLAGLLAYVSLKLSNTPISGPQMGAFGLIMGFALFGKNPVNMLPIIIGGLLYSLHRKEPWKQFTTMPLFATCLAPIVSQPAHTREIIAVFGTTGGVIIGVLWGLAIGFCINSMAAFIRKSHEGLNLYNIGWGAGLFSILITMFYRVIGLEPFTDYIQPWTIAGTSGPNIPGSRAGYYYSMLIYTYLAITAVYFLIFGMIAKNEEGKTINLKELLYMKADDNIFYVSHGRAYTYLAMGVLSILALVVTFPFGVHMTGPIMGAAMSMIGWGGFGKAVANCVTIIAGVVIGAFLRFFLVPVFNPYHALATTSALSFYTAQGVIWTSAFWGTCLSPMAKYFRWQRGIIVGIVHFFFVFELAPFHWGQNLYNNGLAAGFVCVVLIPIFRAWDKKGEFPPRTV